jgi:hypothetical protein
VGVNATPTTRGVIPHAHVEGRPLRLTALSFRNVALVFVDESFVVGGYIAEVSPAPDGLRLTVDLSQRSTGLTNVGCGDVHLVSVATGSTQSGHRS